MCGGSSRIAARFFVPAHPSKRPIWWTNAPFASAIHQNGLYGGRTAFFVPRSPFKCGALPRWGLFSRKVLRFSGGPSMPGAIFPEGPAFFPGTFHARARFPGRSCVFPGDLPCQEPFSRKVLRFSGGPSMPEAIFPEGPCPSALSLRYFGTPGAVRCLIPSAVHSWTARAIMPILV